MLQLLLDSTLRRRAAPATVLLRTPRPKVRRFPASSAEWSAIFPTITAPLAIWTCQQIASPLVDALGAHALAENQPVLYARSGDTERWAVEFDTAATTEFLADPDTAFGDLPAGAPRTLLVRFRCPDNGGVAAAIAGTGSSGSAAAMGLRINAGGKLVARATDGTTSISATTSADADDGIWHDAALVWDRLAGTPALRVLTESELVSTNLGALSAADSGTGIRLGSIHALTPVVGQQVSYMALFATAWTATEMAAFRTVA